METSSAVSHQADQSALAVILQAELAQLALSADETFTEPATALIQQYALASTAVAAGYYEHERQEAGGRTRFTVPIADPPPAEQVQASLAWATAPLWHDPPDRELAQSQVMGAAQRLVVNAGRETLARIVTSDQYAIGWARIPTGSKTCHFCALMCSRGAVYRSEHTAGRGVNARFVGESRFKWHDHCDCAVIPVFRGQRYEPSERIRSWDQLYVESTASVSGKEKLRAFRRAYETNAS